MVCYHTYYSCYYTYPLHEIWPLRSKYAIPSDLAELPEYVLPDWT